MNTTTNYGLKLYEGTDLFNPLTVENVNAGDIDDAMKAISDHSVGTATELTTGTVHAITRADTDRNVFLFVATSNFTAGDTFTLDGNQVSALTPDGQQLATGSYVIGSSVLCALHDTLITVYVNPAKAKDADMLDGHDSSYYATDSDLDTVAGTIQSVSDKVGSAVLTTTAPDLSGAVNELNTRTAPTLISPTWIAGLNISNSEAYTIGNLCVLNLQISSLSIVAGETVLGNLGKTLPTTQIFNYNTYGGLVGEFIITNNGQMKIEHATGFTNDNAYINCVFVIN